ncbi:metal dependent phosphohydrolase [Cladophialophora carrionii]|uniref:Metal dependent phosphohydrolase n=1 Tax=Cladophialophora carrionii TaxID=86049 RepID=A0A1C1CN19_9EURO|nr:metal dependent phosphohydrolase [Cladophialophora carrionii]
MSSPFPSLPVSQITIPSNPLINAAYAYVKENCSECTLNHCVRSAAFALILQKKFPPFANTPDLDTEAVVLSTLLHDMGWATTKALLSKDKRFEVDGANIAREFVTRQDGKWDRHRLQLMWDGIALHTTPSIAQHKEPEVCATQLGIMADFLGPNLPLPGSPITIDEYKEIITAFPRLGFKEELRGIMCGLCRDKPETTYDNFVGDFGKIYGLDGKGGGREEFTKACEEKNTVRLLEGALTACEQYET